MTLELYGDPSGWPGPAAMRRALLACAAVCIELPEAPGQADHAVVSRVRPSGVLIDSALATGQPRWLMGLLVTIRPPTDLT
ncbi:hypothetical protein ABT024_05425 [Streptomyces sp. NPDC002812]|uniref:hypothetical protein n=1 Tax=Streptomyces sp. NPDC002812 TaxID=3154434 RepID=UPI0033248A47